jgi:hypothetical protein
MQKYATSCIFHEMVFNKNKRNEYKTLKKGKKNV